MQSPSPLGYAAKGSRYFYDAVAGQPLPVNTKGLLLKGIKMKYKLTKLSIKEGETSDVGVGHSSTGNTIRVIRFVRPEEVKINDEVYIGTNAANFIKTSPVERIEQVDDNTYTIWTKTSVYHLEKKE